MKTQRTVENKYEMILKKLSRKFPEVSQVGVSESDGFSFDFNIPNNTEYTLSVQVGASDSKTSGYVSGYVYTHGGLTVVEERLFDYANDDEFELAVNRNHGFILRQARKYDGDKR